MKCKRMLSALLSAALLAVLLACPVSAAGVSAFSDIPDAATAEAAELLRALGVVDGVGGGLYQPERSLTRAEFCKMAIEVMGRGGEAAGQSGRVIFSDVKADHWALGYINAAATGQSESEPPLVAGVGNGLFLPEEPITYGAAAAILLRALGYSDRDVGAGPRWYDGYVSTAERVGLSAGLSLDGGDAVTRGQAALLFRNLLFAAQKDSGSPYLTRLGATVEDSAVILSVDGAVRTENGTYAADRAPFPASYEGVRGRLVLDRDGKVLTVCLDETGSDKAVSAVEIQSAYVIAAGGEKLRVDDAGVPVYSADKEPAAYQDAWIDLSPGARLTFHYSPAGKLEYIYLHGGAETDFMVAGGTGTAQFDALIPSGAAYTIVKNGAPASPGDIRPYDVAAYDRAAQVLQVSDLKLTGVYESASPNLTTPSLITVMGYGFPVLPTAFDDLADFRPGDAVTLLLTQDGRVAGAVPVTEARSTVVGIVLPDSTPEKLQVQAVNLRGYTFSGQSDLPDYSVARLAGQLVTVSSSAAGSVTVTPLPSDGAPGDWDVRGGSIGGVPVAENVQIFERVGGSAPRAVDLADVTCAVVPASRLLYVGTDYAGRVNLLIVDDVTGDAYTYGFLTAERVQTDVDWEGTPLYNAGVRVSTVGDLLDKGAALVGAVPDMEPNTPGGVAASLETLGSTARLAGCVLLESLGEVSRSAFSADGAGRVTVTVGGTAYPVADGVVCYNAVTGTWFSSLTEARAFSDRLTLYCDRAPEDGGKIRMVVAER